MSAGGGPPRRVPFGWRWVEPPINFIRMLFGRPLMLANGQDETLRVATRTTGSLTRRMIGIAALWTIVLLAGGGVALDRVLNAAISRNFDDQLGYVLNAMIASARTAFLALGLPAKRFFSDAFVSSN